MVSRHSTILIVLLVAFIGGPVSVLTISLSGTKGSLYGYFVEVKGPMARISAVPQF